MLKIITDVETFRDIYDRLFSTIVDLGQEQIHGRNQTLRIRLQH